jgi:flagellar hook assembly protein FlgD
LRFGERRSQGTLRDRLPLPSSSPLRIPDVPAGMLARLFAVLLATTLLTGGMLATTHVPATASSRPKAVIVVGPVGGLTSSFLASGRRIAAQARAAGMHVRTVTHPAATWERVAEAMQGAKLVVYLGHGNGWPSPYAPYQEATKNGFGLNRRSGGSPWDVEYRGADHLRSSVRLAPRAVVVMYRSCYAAGNGETWMRPERNRSVAAERVDNYAAGFLAIGAAVVFGFGTSQALDLPGLLMRSSLSMDEIFRTRGSSSPSMYDGFQGSDDYYAQSSRTPGARLHLDPHAARGHLRAVTGNLDMTAAAWRGESGKGGGKKDADKGKGKGKDGGKGKDRNDGDKQKDKGKGKGGGKDRDRKRPKLSEIRVLSSGGLDPGSLTLPQFSPDGDGMGDRLRIGWTLSEKAEVSAAIRGPDGRKAAKLTRKAAEGSGAITWDGRTSSGKRVRDGVYEIELTAKDSAANTSRPRTIKVKVATTLRGYKASTRAFHPSDGDRLAGEVGLRVELTRRADVVWRIQNEEGKLVRALMDSRGARPGTLRKTWNGRNDKGRHVSSGWHTATIVARTEDSIVRYQQRIWVGPFRITTSDETARRGERITITLVATEPLRRPPTVQVRQPGVDAYELDTRKVGAGRYELSFRPRSKGKRGELELLVTARDEGGGEERVRHSIGLR